RTGPAATPSNWARSASSSPVCRRSQWATAGHGSSPTSAQTSAPSSAGSSGRAQETAAQPSAVGSNRHEPPTDTLPPLRRPVKAARSDSSRAPSNGTDVSSVNRWASSRARVAVRPDGASGGPSGWPVSGMRPLRAQSASGSSVRRDRSSHTSFSTHEGYTSKICRIAYLHCSRPCAGRCRGERRRMINLPLPSGVQRLSVAELAASLPGLCVGGALLDSSGGVRDPLAVVELTGGDDVATVRRATERALSCDRMLAGIAAKPLPPLYDE